MWNLTACKISVSHSFLNWIKKKWNDFYRISEIMLATLIRRCDKKSFYFKNDRETKFYRLSSATFYDCIHTIYQFIKPFLDNKMSILEGFGVFKPHFYIVKQEFTGVYIIFLITAQKHGLWVLVRTASLVEAVLTSTHILGFEQKLEKYQSFYLKTFSFWWWNFQYIWIGVSSKWNKAAMFQLPYLFWLNTHYTMEESNFNFGYVR